MAFIKKPSVPLVSFLFISFSFVLLPHLSSAQEQQQQQQQLEALTSLSFISDATELPTQEEYDFIIVGGGTAGCPLAATLSQNHRVLVVERGGHILEHPTLLTQEGFLQTLTQVDAFDSPAEAFTSEDGVQNARGRVLGGSSAINAGFYSRSDQDFFRHSAVKWDLDLVNQSYEWVEKTVVFRPELKNWQSAVRDGLIEANIMPYNGFSLDHVVGTKIGGSIFDSYGRRHSAADLLYEAHPPNLKIALHASVERILLDTHSPDSSSSSTHRRARRRAAPAAAAIGILYQDRAGGYHCAMRMWCRSAVAYSLRFLNCSLFASFRRYHTLHLDPLLL